MNEAWQALRCPVAYAYGTLSTAPVIESLPVLRGWQPDIDIRPWPAHIIISRWNDRTNAQT